MKRKNFQRPGRQSRRPSRPKALKSLVLKIRVLTYDKIEFGGHARDRMAQRGITRDEVIEAINNPTSSGLPTQQGRTRVRKSFVSTGKVIDVVYDELPDRFRVITTFPK